MSSYLSSILTNTTSRYTTLRRTLLSDENDGDTEDDSHISRVLRAYYVEKGRPFPPWLPPDPKAPLKAPIEPQFSAQSSRQYGAPQQQMGGGRGRGLSDLWDTPQQGQKEENLSLRRGGPGRGVQRQGVARGGIVDSYDRAGNVGGSGGLQPQPVGRPLPSQRAGSYQSQFSQQQTLRSERNASPPPSSGSGSSAQERLKARLWGGNKATGAPERHSPLSSPGLSQASQRNPYDRERNPYDRGNSYNEPDYGGGSGLMYGGSGGNDNSGSGGYSDAGRRGLGRPPNGPRSR
ncbi:MAG: hypothetical protein M1812_007074 [Candelaria pacifica]|nr:MAG: hypothetical protein M1812_007074 [Candelaria pacifica]